MTAPLVPTPKTHRRRDRLLELCRALPEAVVAPAPGTPHVGFTVRKRTFGWYLFDHHGDGCVSVCVKSTGDRQRALVAGSPERYFVPAYLGARGWVGLRLDLPSVDWREVGELVRAAYCLVAPRKLAAIAMAQ